MFANMLFGKDPAEAYIESDEGKKEITINSSLMAVIHTLVDKKIISNEEFEKVYKKYEEVLKNKVRDEFKKLGEQ